MAVADTLRGWSRTRPRAVTAALSVAGYVLVLGTFAGLVPVYPELGSETVLLLAHLIAVVNTTALVALLAGWRFIKRGAVRKHRAAMLTAFGLILVFLVLYLTKVGGGFERTLIIRDYHFLGAYAGVVKPVYLVMLAVHILLSVLAVPVVIHAVVLGLTHSPAELRETVHARVGRVAAAAWSLSLFFGVVTYVMLNLVYDAAPREAALLWLAVAVPSLRTGSDRNEDENGDWG
jgi:putative membrane protein